MEILDLLLDALLDTLKVLPFLFGAYLLIEYLEHRASARMTAALGRFGRWSPVVGAAAGLVPQCGFSVTAVNLYAGRVISLGTLLAVFIATSDEAVPVMLAHPESYGAMGRLLVAKLVIGAVVGLGADALFRKKPATAAEKDQAHQELHEHCGHHCCEGGILRPALRHTLSSGLFILLTVAALNVAIALVGEQTLAAFLGRGAWFQPALAAVVGLIPNCASSLLLTELYVGGALTFGSLLAGLVVNAGVGLLFLFRCYRNTKHNLAITGCLLVVGMISGFVAQLLPGGGLL